MKIILVVLAVVIAVASLVVSHKLVRDLSEEETNNMKVWAEAMRSLSTADENTDLNLVLTVINGNNTIPVIVLDGAGNVTSYRNIDIPDAANAADSAAVVAEKARSMKKAGNVVSIALSTSSSGVADTIDVVYDESVMLKRLE